MSDKRIKLEGWTPTSVERSFHIDTTNIDTGWSVHTAGRRLRRIVLTYVGLTIAVLIVGELVRWL